VILAFLLIRSILLPIRFNREAETRVEAVKTKLLDIRKAQAAYKSIYGSYTWSFDSLIEFVKNDSFEIRKISGTYPPDEMNEAEALESGVISVAETMVSVKDSLFSHNDDTENLRYVPDLQEEEFVMDAGSIITGSKVEVDVFEVYVLYETLFWDMDKQLVAGYIVEKSRSSGFPGLKLGSMTEAVITGNWE